MSGAASSRALARGFVLEGRWGRPDFLIEIFVLANLAFLTLDVFLAHSVNAFRHPAEWVPVGFSLIGTVALLAGLIAANRGATNARPARGGGLVGWAAIGVGIAGFLLHLESQFLGHVSLRSLVYTAPLAAPLSYAGLGLLLLLNRMVPAETQEWGRWLALLAAGGFVGNFALALLDHAQNGFFHLMEWIPVAASAYAVAFMFGTVLRPGDRRILTATLWVLVLQVPVGLLGLALHVHANLEGPAASLRENFLYGAPAFAPLLLPNLALLGILAVLDLRRKATADRFRA